MSEQDYFEQFTGESIAELPLVLELTAEQSAELRKAWDAYVEANPDWWKHQVIRVVKQ